MKVVAFLLLFFGLNFVYSQQKCIPIAQYYKKEFFRFSQNNSIETFFPANNSQLNVEDSLKDKNIYYYDLPVWLFQKNWIEISTLDGKLSISPIVNFSFGKSNENSNQRLFRNTRGVFLEASFDKFSFHFVVSENQAKFTNYEASYFKDRGEKYVSEGNYSQVNAVIPSSARTKPFKTINNAFDYAYSTGSFTWQTSKNTRLEFGNNQHFIGAGYRSLLLSDNTLFAPSTRFQWSINKFLNYQLLVKKHQNLFRKPSTLSVEKTYENKLFTVHYLSIKLKKNFNLSLFCSSNQLRADSIIKHPIQIQMFVPFLNNDLFYDSRIMNGISGLNLDYSINKTRIYSQIAIDKVEKKYIPAFQIGSYFFNLFQIKNLDFQIELNHVPNQFYGNRNEKLAYSNGNLALAHIKGNNFSEIYGNLSFEKKRFFSNLSSIVYYSKGGNIQQQIEQNSIFLEQKSTISSKGICNIIQTEIGYRINKKYNPIVYVQYRIRQTKFGNISETVTTILGGIKVDLFNQYLDF